MAVTDYIGTNYGGLSTDTKPTPDFVGAIFIETDTDKLFIWNGGSWVAVGGAGGGGANSIELINADETDVSGTTSNGAAKTYSLPANAFSRIVIEAEVALTGRANKEDKATFTIEIDDVVKESVSLKQDATGQGDFWQLGTQLKWSGQEQAAATIDIAVTADLGAGTWEIKSLRVYGVI